MYLGQLVKSKKTVFSTNDLAKLFLVKNRNYLKTVISRLCQRGDLMRIGRGFYALDRDFNSWELANKLKVPSYVSLETVLQKRGVIFQDYGQTVFSISDNSLRKKVAGWTFEYSKIKETVLANPLGVERESGVWVATVERALCDRIYLTPGYYFDNLRGLNLELLSSLSQIYNKRTKKEILEIINQLKKQNYA